MVKGPLDDVQNMDWMADAGDIDQDTIEVEEAGYPVIQWVNGDSNLEALGPKNVLFAGGWALDKQHVDADTLDGWTFGTWSHGKTKTQNFFCQNIEIAVIHHRRCWEVTVNGRRQRYAWDKYDEARAACPPQKNPSSRLHILARVKGLEDISELFMITLSGSVAKEVRGSRVYNGLFQQFQKNVLDAVNNELKKRGQASVFPRYAFWMSIGPSFTAKGDPVFTTVGQGENSSDITLPVLIGVEEKMPMDALRKLYVGKSLAMELMKTYQETESWAQAWDEVLPSDADYEAVAEPEPDEADLITEDDIAAPEQGSLVDRF
jgi:hypothetical protein